MAVAKKHQDKLSEIKKNIEKSYKYFSENRLLYNKFRKFVFETNVSKTDKANLESLGIPPLQFNVTEAYISRLLGEFSKQEPAIEVSAEPSLTPPDPNMIKVVENHMRAIVDNFNEYETYRDLMSGGYSAIKVSTDYDGERSFNYKISVDRVFDPLLVGFDVNAQLCHKGDGNYAFEIFPKTEEEAVALGVNINTDSKDELNGFKWNYGVSGDNIYLIADYYEKKKKTIKIHKLADNSVKTDDEYKKMLKDYKEKYIIEQPPLSINERMTEITRICRYRICENSVLEYKETNFCELPLIFVDGNSILVREGGDQGTVVQITRPYAYNAWDAQKLKNLCGQMLAKEIQNMVSHKMVAAKESIPKDYEEAYSNVQSASNYVYNAFKDDGITPIPPPREVMKVPIPPEIPNTFIGADSIIQNILGSHDASLGINDNQLSGIAIQEGATQSNATAMPHIVNFLKSLQQAATISMDLIPKLYVTPQTIPIIDQEGKRGFQLINAFDTNNQPIPGSVGIKYDSSDLKIHIKAGVNFDVQKNKALQTLIQLGKSFPAIGAILNQRGLPFIFDNLDIRGADQLKTIAEEYVQQQQQQQQQASQGQSQQFNPMIAEYGLKQQKMILDNQKAQAEVSLKQQELQQNKEKMLIDAHANAQDNAVQMAKTETERQVDHTNLALKAHDQIHRHNSDMISHAKDIHNMATDKIQNDDSLPDNSSI